LLAEAKRDLGLLQKTETRAVELSAVANISLGFVVNDLITNGQVRPRLDHPKVGGDPERGYAVSVSNDDLPLPKDFDGAAGKRLGMKLFALLLIGPAASCASAE
jgi:hypothetical protein